MRTSRKLVCCLAFATALCGCHTVRESVPPRTATEQLLLSTAADKAMVHQRFDWLEGKKTYVEDKYFESYDKGYAVGLIRERLSANGALLVKHVSKAEIVVEIRSGALSMDNSEWLIGIPAMTVPLPLAGPVQTPELALYKRKDSDSIAKLVLFAYKRKSEQYLRSVKPMLGRAQLRTYKVLIFSWRKTDVPELIARPKSRPAKTETRR